MTVSERKTWLASRQCSDAYTNRHGRGFTAHSGDIWSRLRNGRSRRRQRRRSCPSIGRICQPCNPKKCLVSIICRPLPISILNSYRILTKGRDSRFLVLSRGRPNSVITFHHLVSSPTVHHPPRAPESMVAKFVPLLRAFPTGLHDSNYRAVPPSPTTSSVKPG